MASFGVILPKDAEPKTIDFDGSVSTGARKRAKPAELDATPKALEPIMEVQKEPDALMADSARAAIESLNKKEVAARRPFGITITWNPDPGSLSCLVRKRNIRGSAGHLATVTVKFFQQEMLDVKYSKKDLEDIHRKIIEDQATRKIIGKMQSKVEEIFNKDILEHGDLDTWKKSEPGKCRKLKNEIFTAIQEAFFSGAEPPIADGSKTHPGAGGGSYATVGLPWGGGSSSPSAGVTTAGKTL